MEMDGDFKFKNLSPSHLEKVILRVQQTRKDRQDSEKLRGLLQNLSLAVPRTSSEPQTALDDSSSSCVESSGDSESSDQSVSYEDESASSSDSEPEPPRQVAVVISKKPLPAKKPMPKKEVEKPKFDHQATMNAIAKSQEAVKSVLQQIHDQLQDKRPSALPEALLPSSPRAEAKRKVRLSEFNARIRRNYIYTLQTEVDKMTSQGQNGDLSMAKNTMKQNALRSVRRALNLSFQALQAYRNQSSARRDLLATLPILNSILELLGKVGSVCNSLEINCENLLALNNKIVQELGSAYVEAENTELEINRALVVKKRPPPKVSKRVPHLQAKQKLKRRPQLQIARAKVPVIGPTILEPVARDASTETEVYLPLTEVASQIKSMKIKPTNVKFVMMHHDPEHRAVEADTQTSPNPAESGEKETQTADQAVLLEEAKSRRIEQMIAEALQSELAGDTDYLADIIEQVISQEFI